MSTFRRSPYLPPLPFFPFPRLYLCPLPPDILPHGTAKRLKGTRRPDKATILSATRKQV